MTAASLPAPESRDRFVGFAFAAAELLAEIGADRRLIYTAGAFREFFEQDAADFTGRGVGELFAPEDHGGLEIALGLLNARFRLAPTVLRLANAARTPIVLSGLRLPHRNGVTWLTMARIPASSPVESARLAPSPLFRDSIEARLLANQPCELGLVEVGGWARLNDATRRGLEEDIARALRDAAGGGAMAAEMSAGRFGVMSEGGIDMSELQERIGRILRAAGAGRPVAGVRVPLALAGIGAAQAVRVMRFAVASFGAGGTGAVRQAGLDEGLRHFLDRTEARAANVRAAIERGKFRLLFQPVVGLADRSVHHYEALLRPFPIAGQERDSTQEFVAFAEAMGLAETLDGAVLRRVVETLPHVGPKVAINVSGVSMQSSAFRARLLDQIAAWPTLNGRLMVELTETADIEDVAAAVDTVTRLDAAGVSVCLDDFGAGFAAFRYLKEFKVAFIKIDGSFVRNAVDGNRDSGFIGAMVELARCVGARAIAETIETQQQATTMAALGVQFGQGWLFGKPDSLPGVW
jgi:EAL domain-containing protein (putative c-di-GMP-specific phosphodiesterase class I)